MECSTKMYVNVSVNFPYSLYLLDLWKRVHQSPKPVSYIRNPGVSIYLLILKRWWSTQSLNSLFRSFFLQGNHTKCKCSCRLYYVLNSRFSNADYKCETKVGNRYMRVRSQCVGSHRVLFKWKLINICIKPVEMYIYEEHVLKWFKKIFKQKRAFWGTIGDGAAG